MGQFLARSARLVVHARNEKHEHGVCIHLEGEKCTIGTDVKEWAVSWLVISPVEPFSVNVYIVHSTSLPSRAV
jgi:hypothetical protein